MTARPFKLTAPEPLEIDIHASVAAALDALLLPPAVWFTYPAGAAQLSPQQMARYSRIGLKRGLPDLFVLHGGRLHGIELKRRGGQLSKTRVVKTRHGLRILVGQAERFAELEAAGMEPIAICRSVDEVLATITRWGIPVRATVSRMPATTGGRVALAQSYRQSP
jgi:hypothetical protein